MRVLITNDDGIGAKGLHELRRALVAVPERFVCGAITLSSTWSSSSSARRSSCRPRALIPSSFVSRTSIYL